MVDPTQKPADPMQSEPAAVESDSTQSADDGTFCVCICVKPDGSMSVGVERGEDPSEYEGFSPAKDVKDALTQALGLIKSGGNAEDMGKQIQSQGFESGYDED